MFCHRCGSLNDDNAWKCVKCGELLQHDAGVTMPAEPIPNYLVHAILVTIFCCWPFGIPAIINAAQVNSKVYAGDIQGALNASSRARMWTWISFGLGLTVNLFWAIIWIAAIAGGSGF